VNWKQLPAENRVAVEPASRAEIKDLRAVVRRNLSDAQIRKLSDDGRFGHAYDAARILANIIVRASGHRVKTDGGGVICSISADLSILNAAVLGDPFYSTVFNFSTRVPARGA